ncbi:MAG: DUF3459 domain-containing protein [Myxococcales bacterium]|nr:DUF3459 domain-containing protein [Myxococcales bacterium]
MVAQDWWQGTTVYQIYPRSFMDADGDGIGDIEGILQRVEYLKWLGVETIWLSPVYASPQRDFGYDISDYRAIAPEYGTMDSMKELIESLHGQGMRLVMDMVMNHTSSESAWFQASKSSRDDPKRDWYIWRDGSGLGGKLPPNNWKAMIGGSGWHYDEDTKQWYWATFLPFQPDLNYRHPDVKKAMLDHVRFWLDQGVDGFRLDIFNAIFKDASFADNPFSLRPFPSEDSPDGFFQRTENTIDHPDTLAFAKELRAVLDTYDDPSRFLVGEVFGSPASLLRYCGEKADGLHLVFLFRSMRTAFRASAFRELIEEYEHFFADPFVPTWVFGNHDRARSIDRLGEDPKKAALLAFLQLTARGVPFLYYGEEIGMASLDLPFHASLDPLAHHYRWVPDFLWPWMKRMGLFIHRDVCRGPMQWSADLHAGFSKTKGDTWLPVHPRFSSVNVVQQRKDTTSLLWVYRRLLHLRRILPCLGHGRLELLSAGTAERSLLGYRRVLEGERYNVEIWLNFSKKVQALPKSAEPLACFSSREASEMEIAWLDRGEELPWLDGEAQRIERPNVLYPWEAVLLVHREE